ncbi:VOC family protein [Aestuariimicrobium ganziense]|uniref:VOC family protein n=1 Tax=Aestuariimicrobium ganziense TaxID=2773677 RepID=UPI001941AFD6|nr:VOC family protein [Aestuariimicrobium ganziense]
MHSAGGRIDFQYVDDFTPLPWPETSGLIHLDFLVDDLEAAERRVLAAGATKYDTQPNHEHCLVFADPVGHVWPGCGQRPLPPSVRRRRMPRDERDDWPRSAR